MSGKEHDKITGLQNFISEVKNKGLMKNTHFGVLINTPSVLMNVDIASAGAMKRYIMFCDSTSLPGTSLSTVDVTAYGEIREQPTQRIYDPVNLTFYVDVNFTIKKLFDLWINAIIDPTTRNHAYYNDYTTTVEIYVFDTEHNTRYKVTLHECYPKSVGNIAMSYGSDGIMKLDVTMQYRYYTVFDYVKNVEIPPAPKVDTSPRTNYVTLSSLASSVAKQQILADVIPKDTPTSLPVSDVMKTLLSTPANPILLLGLQ